MRASAVAFASSISLPLILYDDDAGHQALADPFKGPFRRFRSLKTGMTTWSGLLPPLRRSTLLSPSFRPSRLSVRHKTSGSTKRYLRRQQTDPYGKARQSESSPTASQYVARSAHKLIQLDKEYSLFNRGSQGSDDIIRVVDLGAAPGGWTQVVLQALEHQRLPSSSPTQRHLLIACDLLPLARSILSTPVPDNVDFHFVQGDFTSPTIQATVAGLFKTDGLNPGPITVLSDMRPAVSGVKIRDAQASLDVCLAALSLAESFASEEEGNSERMTLVMKHVQGELTEELRQVLKEGWKDVKWAKPLASRAESGEGYFVVRGRRRAAEP